MLEGRDPNLTSCSTAASTASAASATESSLKVHLWKHASTMAFVWDNDLTLQQCSPICFMLRHSKLVKKKTPGTSNIRQNDFNLKVRKLCPYFFMTDTQTSSPWPASALPLLSPPCRSPGPLCCQPALWEQLARKCAQNKYRCTQITLTIKM